MKEEIYKPLTPKLNIHLDPISGQKMASLDFKAVVYTPTKYYVLDKSEMAQIDDENYSLIVDPTRLDYGAVMVDVIVDVPDDSAPGNIRHEGITFKTEFYIVNRRFKLS